MRARNVKPGFFECPELGSVSPHARLLCIGLWCLADRHGRLKNSPAWIRAKVFPYEPSLDIHGELTVLERLGHIQYYEVNGNQYIQVVNFRKHQSPHHTEKESNIPGPDEGNRIINQEPQTIHCELTVNPPLLNGKNPPDSLIPNSLIQGGAPPSQVKKKAEAFALPDWVPKEEWQALLEVRKQKKAPSTPHALKLLLGALESLRAEGYDPRAVLNQSVVRGWVSVFKIKEDFHNSRPAAIVRKPTLRQI